MVEVNKLIIQAPGLASDGWSGFMGRLLAAARSVAGLLGEKIDVLQIAESMTFDPAKASYNPYVMTYLLKAMNAGRPIYISSEVGQERLVSSISQYLGVGFADGRPRWTASFPRQTD